MSVKIIGMIGVTPPSSNASLHVIEGGLSPFATGPLHSQRRDNAVWMASRLQWRRDVVPDRRRQDVTTGADRARRRGCHF